MKPVSHHSTSSDKVAASGLVAADRKFHYDTRVQLGTTTVLVGGSGFDKINHLEKRGMILGNGLGVGKTTALVELVKGGGQTLERPIDELIIVYTQPQPAYMEMAAAVEVVKLARLVGKITLQEFLALLGESKERTRGIIFDDVEQSKGSGIWPVILESVTRLAHHLNAYVFFTTHLLFVEQNEFRVVQRNCAYIVLFPSIRDRSSVGILARRCFGQRHQVLTKAYEDLLRNPDRFSYLILDLRPRLTKELLRVRHSFRLDAPLVSYLQSSEAPRLPVKTAARSRSTYGAPKSSPQPPRT